MPWHSAVRHTAFPAPSLPRPLRAPSSPSTTFTPTHPAQHTPHLPSTSPPPRPLTSHPEKRGGSLHPSSEGSRAAVPDPRNNREKALRSTRGRQTLGAGMRSGGDTALGGGGSPRRRSHRQDPGWLLQHKQPPPVPEQARVPCFAGEHPLPAIPPLPRCRALPWLLTSSPAPPRNMPFFMFGIRSRRFFFSPPSDTSVTAQALQESLPCRQFLRPKKSH